MLLAVGGCARLVFSAARRRWRRLFRRGSRSNLQLCFSLNILVAPVRERGGERVYARTCSNTCGGRGDLWNRRFSLASLSLFHTALLYPPPLIAARQIESRHSLRSALSWERRDAEDYMEDGSRDEQLSRLLKLANRLFLFAVRRSASSRGVPVALVGACLCNLYSLRVRSGQKSLQGQRRSS